MIENCVKIAAGSPSREWTFIEPSEIAESAGAVGTSTGAIPKVPTPPQAETSGTFQTADYAELSRLLNTHIKAQNNVTSTESTQTVDKAQPDATDNAVKSTKTPPPTPMHPGLTALGL